MAPLNAATEAYLAELRAAGQTPEAAAAAITADPRFARIVQKDELRNLFAVNATLLVRLEEIGANPALPLEVRGGVRRVLNTAQWDTGILDLTHGQYAAEFRQGVAQLAEADLVTPDEAAAFLALGGGPLITRLTAAEVAGYWAQQDRVAAAAGLWARIQAKVAADVSALRNTEAQAEALWTECGHGRDTVADLAALADRLQA